MWSTKKFKENISKKDTYIESEKQLKFLELIFKEEGLEN